MAMIRINLLPGAKKASAKSSASANLGSTTWLAIYVVLGLLTLAVCAILYFMRDSALEEKVAFNTKLETEIAGLDQGSAERLEQCRTDVDDAKRLAEVVDQLERARTGPTRMLMELSKLLSAGGGPTIDPEVYEQLRRKSPHARFNPAWDVRKLWLSHFEETEGACRIKGSGRTNEDVAEFLRRLTLSELFEEVVLQRTSGEKAKGSDVDMTAFELTCKVKY